MKKIRFIIKRLSNPRVRWRLKVGLSVWVGVLLLGASYKVVYDIGYFDALSLENDKNAEVPLAQPVLTIEAAQQVVTGALKEDPTNPKTVVVKVIDNNHKLSSIIIETDKQQKIAWVIDRRLFFSADLFNNDGYNLTEGLGLQHNIVRIVQ